MAILLVTYELQQPAKDQHIHDYLTAFPYWKQLESAWLVDTAASVERVTDELQKLVDPKDVVFVGQLERNWSSLNYPGAGWLNDAARRW